jgi:hypothetical protein
MHRFGSESEVDLVNVNYVDRTQIVGEPEAVHQPSAPMTSRTELDYASPGIRARPPFDFAGALRQATFALGVGLLVFGITVTWGNERAWSENIGAFTGIGAGLIALTISWPGRLGRRRGD